MLKQFLEITGYALADSVNPCAIAVLTMVLISVLIANPKKRKLVLSTGLSFALSIYMGYFFYTIILIQFFKNIAAFFATNSLTIKYIFGGLGMFIGALNIKDYFLYKKGSIGTEMPLFMRPKIKKIIKNITSPKGAFIIGFIVTLFLLPCTAGPLVLAAGSLSKMPFINTLPWIFYYNFIFILPMIIITILIHFGFKEVNEISGWKEKNIKKLHLIAGILLFIIGFSLLKGWM